MVKKGHENNRNDNQFKKPLILKVSLSSLGNVKRKVQRIQILMLGMGGCHRQQYRHNKPFVINRNGLLVFWRTVYLISRDLFKIQMDKSPMVK